MSRLTLFKLFADAIKNAINAGRFDTRLVRPPRHAKPQRRLAAATGPGSLGEYDRAVRAYIDSGRVGARPSRFVQPVRNTAA